jgi:4-oxalomesaconate tautomerase
MSSQTAIPRSVLRGETSKGVYFLTEDLPSERSVRDAVLLAAMGSPDEREIDGMGGGHPLTSNEAVVGRSEREDADVDYLFLQVWPDRAEVSDNQNCGNLLAGVGPFALESGLVAADAERTDVRIWMENTSSPAVAHVETPGGVVRYDGEARIDGIRVTCIDNGMPVGCIAAADLGVTGSESPAELEASSELTERVESVRLAAGRLMNVGDVTSKTVPKMSLLSPDRNGGVVDTRTFVPHQVHDAIGVFGAVSVATTCLVPGSVAADFASVPSANGAVELEVEYPSGFSTASMDVDVEPDNASGKVVAHRAALSRTARLLMRGDVFVPASVWASR